MVEEAVLIAIILMMAFTPIGYIKVGALSISLITIPVAIGAIAISPAAGALLGCVFGITSFAQCFTGDAFGAALISISPFYAFLVCIPTRILAGWLCGLVFKALHRPAKLRKISYYIGGFSMGFFNTVFFMSVLVICYWNAEVVQAWSQSLGALNPITFIVLSISLNAIVEWVSCTVVGGVVGLALSKANH